METSPVVALIKGGKMRALAIVGTERHPVLSDIPTTKEQGFPEFVGGSTSAAFTRLRTPRDVQQKLNIAFNKAVSTPEMNEWFTKVGARPINMELDELRAWYLKELADWKDVVTRAKIPHAD